MQTTSKQRTDLSSNVTYSCLGNTAAPQETVLGFNTLGTHIVHLTKRHKRYRYFRDETLHGGHQMQRTTLDSSSSN
uniref:Uncharacterized protein n=1 Tax=Arundo donax TaxID=35708 RepID=A0A0A9EFF2_ARUDO